MFLYITVRYVQLAKRINGLVVSCILFEVKGCEFESRKKQELCLPMVEYV